MSVPDEYFSRQGKAAPEGGVGFKTADEIAARVGIKTDSDFRIKSGIQYVLQQAAMDGFSPQRTRRTQR